MENRDELLKELRKTALRITDKNLKTGLYTLNEKYLMEKDLNAFRKQEEEFHRENPNLLILWNVKEKNWEVLENNNIVYVEDVDVL